MTGIGIVYDYTIGVPRYNKGIRDEWSVSPQKAGLKMIQIGLSEKTKKYLEWGGICIEWKED